MPARHGKKKIAFVLLSCSDLTGGGGAERLFCDAYDFYQKKMDAEYELYFITDESSYETLRSVGRLKMGDRIIRLKLSPNIVFHVLCAQVQLIRTILECRFDLIHICLPCAIYVPFLTVLNMISGKKIRPKITINIVDCSLAHYYLNLQAVDHYGQWWHYRRFFKFVKLDGIFTWYQLFKKVVDSKLIKIRGAPIAVAARFCFTNVAHFHPSKDKRNIVVFAGRLELLKRPLFFVEAIKMAKEMAPELVQNWRFLIMGKGPIEQIIRKRIQSYQLEELVHLGYQSDMAPIFAGSKVFISTQDYENFTSLSMLEAMASGNAIIARNVGQTHYFVKHGLNGLLLKEDTPHGLALAMLEYMRDFAMQQRMQEESRRIATIVHTAGNFLDDIENFWRRVLDART